MLTLLRRRRRALAALAAVAATGLAAVSIAPAQAASGGNFVICAHGNYASFGVAPDGLQTHTDHPGADCASIWMGTGSSLVSVDVFGVYNTHPDSFYIGTVSFRPCQGIEVHTEGVSQNGKYSLTVEAGTGGRPCT
jgi:hypothetical protein